MPHLYRLAATLSLALLAATTVHAQMARVQPSTSPKPSASAVAAQGTPNPAGLRSAAPAGLTAGSGGATSSDPNIANSSIISGVGSSAVGSDMQTPANATATMGAGAGGSRGPSQFVGSGGAGFSAVDIARSFINADSNRDGELTEGEARRLSISMMSFQEMDRDFDGKVSRGEYEDSLR
ncbi:MAG: hypothetical protein JWQ76_2098 [Ramlibacter sp.]|nr:hypothetical protein [Ramlibacter sp.]